MIKGRSVISLLLVAIAFLAFALAAPAEAKKKKAKTKPKAQRVYTLSIGLGLTYDDNIMRYSDSDLESFGIDPGATKYAIKSESDWIISPELKIQAKRKFIAGHTGWLSLGYAYYGYMENDIRRYNRMTLEARQYFNSRTYAQLIFAYVPSYYYRNVLYSGTGPSEYLEAKFSKPSLGLEVGYDITKTLRGTLEYQYQHKSYEDIFEYRNLNVHGLEAWAISRHVKNIRLWVNSGFEFASAKGADMPDTILDVSYNAWDVTLGSRYYSRMFRKHKPELYLSFQYRNIAYQSSRLPDYRRRHIYHYGRTDNNYVMRVGTDWQIPYKVRLGVSYALYLKRTNLPNLYPDMNISVPETTAELERKLDYNANSISIKLSRQF